MAYQNEVSVITSICDSSLGHGSAVDLDIETWHSDLEQRFYPN